MPMRPWAAMALTSILSALMTSVMVIVAGFPAAPARAEAGHESRTLAFTDKQATNEKGPDYADGLTGGPDYWQVNGVDADDMLNIRMEPSTAGALVARAVNGTILRNLGCKINAGKRWCQVERTEDAGTRGWAMGRYLREVAGPR